MGQKSENESKPKCEQDEEETIIFRGGKTTTNKPGNGTGSKSLKQQRELRTDPPKILCWNAHGLISKDTKWKIDALKEHVRVNNIFLMNFTETWFKK